MPPCHSLLYLKRYWRLSSFLIVDTTSHPTPHRYSWTAYATLKLKVFFCHFYVNPLIFFTTNLVSESIPGGLLRLDQCVVMVLSVRRYVATCNPQCIVNDLLTLSPTNKTFKQILLIY